MKYFAFYDDNNEVRQVLPVPDLADESNFAERLGMSCKETFRDGSVRGIFAGCGCVYIPDRDIFMKPKPYPSWVLSTEKPEWVAPVAKPSGDRNYFWDEDSLKWQFAGVDISQAADFLNNDDFQILQEAAVSDNPEPILDRLSDEGRAYIEGSS